MPANHNQKILDDFHPFLEKRLIDIYLKDKRWTLKDLKYQLRGAVRQ